MIKIEIKDESSNDVIDIVEYDDNIDKLAFYESTMFRITAKDKDYYMRIFYEITDKHMVSLLLNEEDYFRGAVFVTIFESEETTKENEVHDVKALDLLQQAFKFSVIDDDTLGSTYTTLCYGDFLIELQLT